MVLQVTGTYTYYLRSPARRDGRTSILAAFPLRLETIPLGVDLDRYRPASREENSSRASMNLEVGDDEVAVLYVGRLSHHAKRHPFPMFRGAT